jgi:hypothetical protein
MILILKKLIMILILNKADSPYSRSPSRCILGYTLFPIAKPLYRTLQRIPDRQAVVNPYQCGRCFTLTLPHCFTLTLPHCFTLTLPR